MTDYDSELRRHEEVLRRACAVRPGERVLDIGCGAGSTTRAAGLIAAEVLGIDVRPVPAGAEFVRGDAQTYPFPAAHFDLAMSRFGTMFFADPVAAFANIRRAVRPGGRLAMLVWQSRDRNEWSRVISDAPVAEAAFSLGDPARTRRILGSAGWDDVVLTDVHEPVHYGRTLAEAEAWVRGFAGKPPDHPLQPYLTADGVLLDSRAWLVTAARRDPGPVPGRVRGPRGPGSRAGR